MERIKRKNILLGIIVLLSLFLILTGCTSSDNITLDNFVPTQYTSNNPYNTDFSNYDITSAEKATYDQYITELAQQQILNQKIFVEIKSIQKVNEIDKSSATKKETEYTFLLEDYDRNCWITVSNRDIQDNSYNIKIKNDLKCYGKYLGILEYNMEKYPQLDISYIYKNLDKIPKEQYISIGNNYINSLNTLYLKEKFEYKEIKEKTGYNELIYTNQNNDLTIELIIDEAIIKMASLSINDIKVNFDNIDKNFLIAFLLCFNEKINSDNAEIYLSSAKAKKSEFEQNAYNKNYQYNPYELNDIILDISPVTTLMNLYYKI